MSWLTLGNTFHSDQKSSSTRVNLFVREIISKLVFEKTSLLRDF